MSIEPRTVVLEREPAGMAEAMAHAGATLAESAEGLQSFDVALVCDEPSLARARDAGIPLCIGVPPAFDLAAARALDSADAVALAHADLARALHLPAARVLAPGPVPPAGFAPAADRVALREESSIDGASRVVLISRAAMQAFGSTAWLVQLSLLESVCILFEVGADARLAGVLRRDAPAHGLDALMFGGGDDAVRAWQVADLAVVSGTGLDAARACGVGAPVVIVDGERAALDLLVRLGVARVASNASTAAVELEQALEADARARAVAAIGSLDPAGAAARCRALAVERWRARAPAGLPRGLERISSPASRSAAPGAASPHTGPGAPQDVEAELEALKKRLEEPGPGGNDG